MTTRGKLELMLVERGMFESQAKSVMDIAIPELDKVLPSYKITWNRDASEYPDVIYPVMFLHVKKIALQWIEDNCPQAWFKQMFE